jgi:hypothetical protein
MTVSLKSMIDRLPPHRRRKVAARAAALIAEEMSMAELRKDRARTQTEIARHLRIGQDGVSRVEKRADLRLSTLRDYVAALGGELDLIVRFPDRAPVSLVGFVPTPARTRNKP